MPRHVSGFRSLPIWVLTGLVFDAAVLTALYALLAAAGPLRAGLEEWLVLLVFIATIWFVHVSALPIASYGRIPKCGQVMRLSVRGLAFTTIAGAIPPILGLVGFFLVAMAIRIVAGEAWPAVDPISWHAQLVGWVVSPVITTSAGAAVGGLLGILRPTDLVTPIKSDESQHCYNLRNIRSDILGGAIAGALVAGGLGLTGLWSHSAITLGYHQGTVNLVATPHVSLLVLVGMVALLPHVVLTGVIARRS
jgi:hypothetical protein